MAAPAPKPRIRAPKTAAAGEVVTIKTLISHEMESGLRRNSAGETIPRHIINSFRCAFNGQQVFACDIEPSVSANPYIEFSVRIPESGTLAFTWVEDGGAVITAEETVTVG
jgi:sulfur-oxidizing protein SoxZ